MLSSLLVLWGIKYSSFSCLGCKLICQIYVQRCLSFKSRRELTVYAWLWRLEKRLRFVWLMRISVFNSDTDPYNARFIASRYWPWHGIPFLFDQHKPAVSKG